MRKRIYRTPAFSIYLKYVDQSYIKMIPEPDKLQIQSEKIYTRNQSNKNFLKAPIGFDSVKDKYRQEGIKNFINKMRKKVRDFELSEERHKFDANQGPHAAFNIFIKCVENGYYPPVEVLNYLSRKFKKYQDDDRTLDEVMGITKRAKNEYEITTRNTNIVFEIDILKSQFGMNTTDAINLVQSRIDESDIKIGINVVTDVYYRYGKELMENSLRLNHDDFDCIEELPDEDINKWRNQFLSKYPADKIQSFKIKYKWSHVDVTITNVTT